MRLRSLLAFTLVTIIAVHTGWPQVNFWQQTGGPLATMDVRCFASNSQGHLLAGTWTDGRVYRTTNNGTTWTACGDIPNANPVMGLCVDHHDHIFASVYLRGMARSTDNGATWEIKNTGLTNSGVRATMVDRQGNIWVATQAGMFCSTDGGETWVNKKAGEFYLVFQDSTGAILTQDPGYFFRSTDGGKSWSSSPTVPRFGLGGVHADGSYWGYVWGYIPDSRIVRSTDRGVTWVDMNSPVSWSGGTSAMMFTPAGDVYYARNGDNTGVLRSTDNGESWHIQNDGLTTTAILPLFYHPNGYLFLGTATAGVFRSTQPLVPQDITVSLPAAVTTVNATVEIPVNVSNLSGWGILSYDFTVEFNRPDSILHVDTTPITAGTLSGQNGWSVLQNTSTPNKVHVAAYGAVPLSGQGTLLKIKVTVLSSAAAGDSSVLVFTHFLFNAGGPEPTVRNGSIAIRERVCGDADENGSVQAYDAALALREALGPMSPPPPPLTAMGRINADVTMNGKVEAYDAALILRHVLDLPLPDSTITCFGSATGGGTVPDSLAVTGKVLGVEHGADRTAVAVQLSNVPPAMAVYSCTFELTTSATSDDTTSLVLPALPQGSLATVNRLGYGHFNVGIVNPFGLDVEGLVLTLSAKNAGSLNTIVLSKLFLNDAPNAEIVLTNITTGVKSPANAPDHPASFDLIGAYPNPFNPSTRIVFQTPASGQQVQVEIFNSQGSRIRVLWNGQTTSGQHEVYWDGTNEAGQTVATGQYFCVMKAGSFRKTIHLLMLK